MNIVFVLAIGLFVGLAIGYFIGKRQRGKAGETFVNDAEKLKSEKMAKLKEYLASQTDSEINNEDIRKLLKVSDTTACRYLNDLEKDGLVKQVGSDGPKVYYRKN